MNSEGVYDGKKQPCDATLQGYVEYVRCGGVAKTIGADVMLAQDLQALVQEMKEKVN